jgi:hypothetical protein
VPHRLTIAPASLLASALLVLGACAGGSPSLGPNGVTAESHAVYFKLAGSHVGLQCYDCHEATNSSFGLTLGGVSCTGSTCHPDPVTSANHSSVQGFGYDTPDCVTCHKDGSGVVNHTFFPTAAGTTHGNVACSQCHGATRAEADLQCIGCHDGTHPHADQAYTDQVHASVTGYVYASPSCYECHKDGTAGLPPGHDVNDFPITGTPHAGIGCGQCHGADKTLAQINCTSSACHPQAATQSQHASVPAQGTAQNTGQVVPNYQWSTPSCLKCHPQGRFTIAGHPRVNNGITGRHGPYCFICHTSPSSVKSWTMDFKQSTCLGCHDTNNPN